MSSSNAVPGKSTGAPRIQISLKDAQRKNMAAGSAAVASVTPAKNSSSDSKTSIHSTIGTPDPGLYKSVRKALKNQTLNFKINVECTSLKVSPSGNFLWGGFSDGTLRVWDLSGTFGIQEDDVIASRQKTDVLVNSKLTQGFGAVACQIHARGVHTDLITTVDISDDAEYVFVGVARGAMELHAVYVGDLERAVHAHKQRELLDENIPKKSRNILDYIKVYCHSDAKLKGFGACATMRVKSNNNNKNAPPSYLLLTGKGIKNIHIWKFTPPEHPGLAGNDGSRVRSQSVCDPPDDDEDNGIWDQLYDTSTNGNTIVLLSFYRDSQNKLLAVSKSDAQKLRLWDLSLEEQSMEQIERPKRPPYQDVANSQSALEISGGIGVCGGGNMYNEMRVVSLDKPDDPFNHIELALPSSNGASPNESLYSSRRQRRGEMKAVVKVATCPRDSSHALLELDDGSLVGYSAGSSSSKDSNSSIPKLAIATPESTGIPALPADFWRRSICLANVAGVVIAASSLYNPNTNKGQLVIRALGGLKKPRGSEVEKKKKRLKQQQKQREREALMLQQRKQAAEGIPETPSPIHAKLQSSPVAADSKALRDAVSAPTAVPVSVQRSNINTNLKETSGAFNATTVQDPSISLTRVSPNAVMETPRHSKGARTELDDSPDATPLPKISKFLQPKHIDMQAQNNAENTKKRKASETLQVKSIGSIPFKSPKPISRKSKKVSAPSKPKKSTNSKSLSSTSFSTPNASLENSSKEKSESSAVVPVKLGETQDAKVSKAEEGNRKRDRNDVEKDIPKQTSRKTPRMSEEMSTAMLLTSLASPKPASKTKLQTDDATPKIAATASKQKSVASQTKAKSTTKSNSKPRGKSTPNNSAKASSQISFREEVLHEKILEQYKQLRSFLKGITDRSMALIHSRNLRGPIPSALAGSAKAKSDDVHVSVYAKLLAEHRAAHDYLQRRLLQSAETTLRLLLESRITPEEARTELKQSIKKFEEILYDTLHRQESERLAVVAQHHWTPAKFCRGRGLGVPNDKGSQRLGSIKEDSSYPCKEAFDKIEDICTAITRPVGRPRSALAALR